MNLAEAMNYLESSAQDLEQEAEGLDNALDVVLQNVSRLLPDDAEVEVAGHRYANLTVGNWSGTTHNQATGIRVYVPEAVDWLALHLSALSVGGGNIYSWQDNIAPLDARIEARAHLTEIVLAFGDIAATRVKKIKELG